ncbi:MAG: SLBB domain-containing protein [Gemmatimonadota bacterium]|nr:SLBB domain-containing protein [Gemmatimonadota bacterium]MDH3368123.1 SLBB domain-containing protein [Gemmatimonadota bacterium]MDH3479999.1 SLBB domain-containing protein [Gemmatimonadota bacterium]MDH3571875.1 SLBB domain-containing protein [Gemmatimonadota bacterium]MDH5550886.1 SLBB domain-containing protein [Gemmatimonadota bacterium]
MLHRILPLGLGSVLLTIAIPTMAQDTPKVDPARSYIARPELDSLLGFFERSAASPAYSARLRERAESEAGAVRGRLQGGDFQVGDRVVLVVDGQPALTDTFTVGNGEVLRLPELGEVELAGVLRSELAQRIEEFLGRYVKELRLESRSLVRIQFDGAVARPGFYTVPSETPLPDAIMVAGGPVGTVDLDGIRVERRGRRLLTGRVVQDALAEGKTLDQLNLRAGDRIVIPQRSSFGSSEGTIRTISLLVALPFTIVGLVSLFR